MLDVIMAEVDGNALVSIGIVVGVATAAYFRDRKTSSAAKEAKTAAVKATVAAEGTQSTVDRIATTQDERTGKLDELLEAYRSDVGFAQKFSDLAQQSMDTNGQLAGYLRDCEASKAELQGQVNALNHTVTQLEAKVANLEAKSLIGQHRRSTDA